MKRLLRWIAMIAIVTLMFDIVTPAMNLVQAASTMTLSNGKAAPDSIYVGHTYKLTVQGKNVKFSSSNKKIAIINRTTGKLKPVAPGTVKISAKDKKTGKTIATHKFTVKQRASKITIDQKIVYLDIKQTYQIEVTKIPATSTDTLSFISSNKKVARVGASSGKVKGIAEGEANITVYAKASKATKNSNSGNKIATVKIIVGPVIDSARQLSKNEIKLVFQKDLNDYDVNAEDFIVQNKDTKNRVTVSYVKVDKKEVFLTLATKIADGKKYKVSFHNMASEFKATDGKIAGINITPKEIPINAQVPIHVELLDINGVKLVSYPYGAINLPKELEFHISPSGGYVNQKGLLLTSETAYAKATAVLHTNQYKKGQEVGAITSGEITITALKQLEKPSEQMDTGNGGNGYQYIVTPRYKISAKEETLDFGTVWEGYTQPAAKIVTITNEGNQPVVLSKNSLKYFTVSDFSTASLEAGKSATISVQFMDSLPFGKYVETLMVKSGDLSVEIELKCEVKEKLSVSLIADKTDIQAGESLELTASVTGGSGNYTYTWYENDKDKESTERSYRPVTKDLKGNVQYRVKVTDNITGKVEEAAKTIYVKTYTILSWQNTLDFGTEHEGYTNADTKTIRIMNTGNQTVTLSKKNDLNYFKVIDFTSETVAPGYYTTLSVQPKDSLLQKDYTEKLIVCSEGNSIEIDLNFQVESKFKITISPTANNGSSIYSLSGTEKTLVANVTGNIGECKYKWTVKGSDESLGDCDFLTVKPTSTTTYRVEVTDDIETKSAEVTVEIKAWYVEIEPITIIKGDSVTLTPNIYPDDEKNFSPEWYNRYLSESDISELESDGINPNYSGSTSYTVQPTESTTYTFLMSRYRSNQSYAYATVNVISRPDYYITASTKALSFDCRNEGYTTLPDAQTVTIKNEGKNAVTLSKNELINYTVSDFPSTPIAPNETVTFTVQPKAGCMYSKTKNREILTVQTNEDANALVSIGLDFQVDTDFQISISPKPYSDSSIICSLQEETKTLTVNVTGNTGDCNYQWTVVSGNSTLDTEQAKTSSITVKPGETTTYKVEVTDAREKRSAEATVQIQSYYFEIEGGCNATIYEGESYELKVNGMPLDGTSLRWTWNEIEENGSLQELSSGYTDGTTLTSGERTCTVTPTKTTRYKVSVINTRDLWCETKGLATHLIITVNVIPKPTD